MPRETPSPLSFTWVHGQPINGRDRLAPNPTERIIYQPGVRVGKVASSRQTELAFFQQLYTVYRYRTQTQYILSIDTRG